MYASMAIVLHPTDRPDSRADNHYVLGLAGQGTGRAWIQTDDPRIARDYFAALIIAAQQLVDAADLAILAESLDGAA